VVSQPAQRALARFCEERRDEILAAFLAQTPLRERAEIASFLTAWVDYELARLRGDVSFSGEWAARFLEARRASDASLEDVLATVYAIRQTLLDLTLGHLPGVSDREIYDLVLADEQLYIAQIAQLYGVEQRNASATERRLQRAMAESMDYPFALLDGDGRIVLANTRLADLLGIAVPNLARRTFLSFCAPETAAEIRRDLRQKRRTSPREFEGALIATTDMVLPGRFSSLPIFDEMGFRSGVGLTMRFKAKSPLSSEYFDAEPVGRVADALDIGIFLLDSAFHVVHANLSARRLSGATADAPPGELDCGQSCREFGIEHRRCGACVSQNAFAEGRPHEAVTCWEFPDGSRRWFSLCCVPVLDETGRLRRIVKTCREITQEKTLEDQILRQQRSSLVSQLAITVAHQLRNPLGVMIGYAEMLSRGLHPDQQPLAIEKILRNGIRSKRIVDDLLEFGRGTPRERVPLSVNDLIRDHVMMAYPASVARRISLDLAPDLPAVECVPDQLAQVLLSLLENALWAAEERVGIETFRREGSPTSWPATNGAAAPVNLVCIRVWDDGPGVPETIRRLIFDPFFTTRKETGAIGLGLSLARSAVQEHGGRLVLDDAVHSGTAFLVQIPALDAAVPVNNIETVDQPPTSAAPHRILIVDDEQDLLEMLAASLELRGYQVDRAVSATGAMALLKGTTYSLAVLDVLLPGDLGGEELYQIMRSTTPELANRTLFITADTMSLGTCQFLEGTGRPFLEKPFLVSVFVDKVEEELLLARTEDLGA